MIRCDLDVRRGGFRTALHLESDAVEEPGAPWGHAGDPAFRLQRRLALGIRRLVQAEQQIGHLQHLEIAADGRLGRQPATRRHLVPEEVEQRGHIVGVAGQAKIEPLAFDRIGQGAAGGQLEAGERHGQLA